MSSFKAQYSEMLNFVSDAEEWKASLLACMYKIMESVAVIGTESNESLRDYASYLYHYADEIYDEGVRIGKMIYVIDDINNSYVETENAVVDNISEIVSSNDCFSVSALDAVSKAKKKSEQTVSRNILHNPNKDKSLSSIIYDNTVGSVQRYKGVVKWIDHFTKQRLLPFERKLLNKLLPAVEIEKDLFTGKYGDMTDTFVSTIASGATGGAIVSFGMKYFGKISKVILNKDSYFGKQQKKLKQDEAKAIKDGDWMKKFWYETVGEGTLYSKVVVDAGCQLINSYMNKYELLDAANYVVKKQTGVNPGREFTKIGNDISSFVDTASDPSGYSYIGKVTGAAISSVSNVTSGISKLLVHIIKLCRE